MIDLTDVTFTIPVRYDTDDRIENISLIVDYLNHNFNTNIIVMEEAKEAKFEFLKDKVQYHFTQTDDKNLHRTKCLNDMAKLSTTAILSNYDTDVLFPVSQYVDAVNMIRNGAAQMVFPYAGEFLECPRNNIDIIRQSMNVEYLNNIPLHCNHPQSIGGCVFWDKGSFINFGMENQNFKSWGWEDNERISRAKKLGITINRSNGKLFHLTHRRLEDSVPANSYYKQNEIEFNKIDSMNKQQLESYIKTWEWLK